MKLTVPMLLVASLVATAAADKAKVPKQVAAQQALLRAPKALDHLRVFAVDEHCFPDNALEGKDLPHGAGIARDRNGHDETVNLILDGEKPAPLATFKTWITKFKKPDRKFGFSSIIMADAFYGYRGVCLVTPPVLDTGELGHVVNKQHPELDKANYRIAFPAASIEKLKHLPAGTLRIAVVYDDDNIIELFSTVAMDLTTDTVLGLYKL